MRDGLQNKRKNRLILIGRKHVRSVTQNSYKLVHVSINLINIFIFFQLLHHDFILVLFYVDTFYFCSIL